MITQHRLHHLLMLVSALLLIHTASSVARADVEDVNYWIAMYSPQTGQDFGSGAQIHLMGHVTYTGPGASEVVGVDFYVTDGDGGQTHYTATYNPASGDFESDITLPVVQREDPNVPRSVECNIDVFATDQNGDDLTSGAVYITIESE